MRTTTGESVEKRSRRSPRGGSRDYEQLAAELVRAWRGNRTLAAFSRRLGSSGGMVHNWEAQRRWPTAARALWCAERVGVDLAGALCAFYGRQPEWLERVAPATPEGVVELLRDWAANTPVTEIAARAGRSRFAVARWLNAKAEPRLPDFLRLMDALSLRLVDFVATLADPMQLPSLSSEWERLRTARSLAYEMPWSHAVLRGLELESYRSAPAHDEQILASALGTTPAQVRLCLQLLVSAGQIEWHQGLYRGTSFALDTRADPIANRRLKQWWGELALGRLQQGVDGQFSFNLFSVSSADLERIRDLQLRYFRELRQIVAQSAPSERVAVVNLQLVDLGALASHSPVSTDSHIGPRN
jgi:transcriptional regulator with XRE-family HTH domain